VAKGSTEKEAENDGIVVRDSLSTPRNALSRSMWEKALRDRPVWSSRDPRKPLGPTRSFPSPSPPWPAARSRLKPKVTWIFM
jgi:hypothetical protein